MSRIRSLELRAPYATDNELNTLHIEHDIPLATKLFRKNMRDDIAEIFFNSATKCLLRVSWES